MQRKTQTALAALMALGLAGGAMAQSSNANADVGVDTGASGSVGASADVAASGNAGGNAQSDTKTETMAESGSMVESEGGVKTFGQLVSSLRTSDTITADLSGFDAESDVTFTALSELQGEGAENAQAIDQILSERQEELDELRSGIEANTDLMAALEAEGYVAEDVIAVETDGDAGVTFYVDDTM